MTRAEREERLRSLLVRLGEPELAAAELLIERAARGSGESVGASSAAYVAQVVETFSGALLAATAELERERKLRAALAESMTK